MEQTEIAREQGAPTASIFGRAGMGGKSPKGFFMDCVGVSVCGVWGISAIFP